MKILQREMLKMFEVEQSLFSLFHIGISIQAFNKRSEKILGISLVQWCLLRRLIDMPATSAYSLAISVGVHPSTLTQTLKRLERKKLIFVISDPKDSRKKLISITRAGMELLDKAQGSIEKYSKELSVIEGDLFHIKSHLQNLPLSH